jgi:hypothetical protein
MQDDRCGADRMTHIPRCCCYGGRGAWSVEWCRRVVRGCGRGSCVNIYVTVLLMCVS